MNNFNEDKVVGALSELLALKRGYPPAKARQIRNAAVLHDVGKQRIDEKILNKPGKLSAREFEIMKTHTKLGVEILSSIQGELGEMAILMSLYHHEWESGGGYWGVPMYYLPDYVSFVSIADTYTALMAKRPYKSAWPPGKALSYIQSQAGTRFCPELVKDFTSLILSDSRVPALFTPVKI